MTDAACFFQVTESLRVAKSDTRIHNQRFPDKERRVFAGIVEEMGRIVEIRSLPPGKRLAIQAGRCALGVGLGDSICVSGCCLTVVAWNGDILEFDAGPETLARTILGELQPGDAVNLERSLQIGDRLGGHFVTGHVDGVGTVRERIDEQEWSTFWFHAPGELTRQMASKGSVAVDGISLTLVDVTDSAFSVALIPHTLRVTTLGAKTARSRVNLETDLLAKYVQRQLTGSAPTLS